MLPLRCISNGGGIKLRYRANMSWARVEWCGAANQQRPASLSRGIALRGLRPGVESPQWTHSLTGLSVISISKAVVCAVLYCL